MGGLEKNGGNIKKIQEMMGQYVVRYLIIGLRHEDYDEGILSLCDLRDVDVVYMICFDKSKVLHILCT